ncbi:MAG TPA: hypothetical protein PK360_08485 [bacterium]|nr:hypothetical protein [bacterium]
MRERITRQLVVCLEQNSGEVFYASLSERKDWQAKLRTTWEVKQGDTLFLLLVPPDWNGGAFSPHDIRNSDQVMEAQVNRMEKRGTYHIRIRTNEQQEILDRVRCGLIRDDRLAIDCVRAGKVDIYKLTGRLGVQSVLRLQSTLRKHPLNRRLVLLDLTKLLLIAGSCVGMLYTILKEERDRGLVMDILNKPEGRVHQVIANSKIPEIVPVFSVYEDAVACLLRTILV